MLFRSVELSGGIAGVLPNPHLSDHVGHCEAIRATLSKGSVLKEMLVWSKNEAQKRITLSCKPSLIEAAKSGQLLQAREDFTSGTLSTVRAASAPLACEHYKAVAHIVGIPNTGNNSRY